MSSPDRTVFPIAASLCDEGAVPGRYIRLVEEVRLELEGSGIELKGVRAAGRSLLFVTLKRGVGDEYRHQLELEIAQLHTLADPARAVAAQIRDVWRRRAA